jgi:LPXTG-motif cell wall-anchored protein
MNRNAITRALGWGFAILALVGCITVTSIAQQTATVERGEVVTVSGNEIVVKMDTGEVRHFTAPPGATATVDGKQLTVAELQPGMKLQRTITTTTAQRTVKSVRTVNGTVWQVNAPYVIFTGADGKNKQVKVPDGTKFTIEGEKKTVFDLRKGMKFTATVMTEAPETVVSTSRSTTGSAPPPPKPVIAAVPAKIEPTVLIEEAAPAPAPKPVAVAAAPAAEPAPAKLPKTGTPVPLIGLMGLTMSLAGLGMRLARKR